VFVLTSPETFSGGEELAYDLQTFKRGMVVGEVTGGGANPGGPESLGHQFVVNMPSGQAVNPVTGGSWEGVGVRPDVAVPAPQALSNAHRLAVQRLLDETRDPVPRSLLEAVAMKLESLAQAESGEVVRIANAQLIGTYVLLAGQGAAVTIQDKDGRLVQRVGGFPDVRLILIGGNRYRLEGSPEGSFTSFRLKDGKVQLLREAPGALPRMREKQAASP
jgi:FtsP/CotA-like multicopper oxidase with cupredoxin domain